MIQIIKSWPCFDSGEINSVTQLLAKRSFIADAQNEIRLFEQECAKATQREYALAVANDTVALEIALSAIDIKKPDEVILPGRITIDAAAPVVRSGAMPVTADIDSASLNLNSKTIENLITDKTKAIICFHHAGWPCEMDSIQKLAEKHALKVIEICSQAQGAKYKNKPVGSIGDVAVFSFGSDAIISTGGEGGMLLCNDEEIFNKARQAAARQSASITSMQAALGRSQLSKLAEMVDQRRKNAEKFNRAFSKLNGLKITIPPEEFYHSYNHYYCFLDSEKIKSGVSAQDIMQQLIDRGIPVFQPVCGEIYTEKAFCTINLPYDFPAADKPLATAKKVNETAISLPVHPALTEENISDIIQTLTDIIKNVC